MNQRFFEGELRFEQVRGVGTIEVDFQPNQRVYTLIGENGVGKTKFLESMFTLLLLSHSLPKNQWINKDKLSFKKVTINGELTNFDKVNYPNRSFDTNQVFLKNKHSQPVIYLSAQNRGSSKEHNNYINQLGNKEDRLNNYLSALFSALNNPEKLKNINMNIHIEEWIIQRAQSANKYQAKEDNREIELSTLLSLLNQIDSRIDADFLEISGDNRVFIKIENQKRELSELSSGFMSIFKIMQAIISGYSYFTNEVQIANVRGLVLIDEIESHLHNEWQVKIIPLLKKLFPNTTFFITTHSSLVISQLEQGEAYRLVREQDGVVYGNAIARPSSQSMLDLLNEAFNVNLNQLKIERAKAHKQIEAKKALLALVQQELDKVEAK